jgi:hypothetical protein
VMFWDMMLAAEYISCIWSDWKIDGGWATADKDSLSIISTVHLYKVGSQLTLSPALTADIGASVPGIPPGSMI